MAHRGHFGIGSGVYSCNCCGRKTRSTGRGDNELVKLCEQCFDLAGIENAFLDGCQTDEDVVWAKNLMRDLGSRGNYLAPWHDLSVKIVAYEKALAKEIGEEDAAKILADDVAASISARLHGLFSE